MISQIMGIWQQLFWGRRGRNQVTSGEPRVLWVHAGGHKTGTKTLQNYLMLGGLGVTAPQIFYRKIRGMEDPKHMNCGNGQDLFPLGRTKELAPALEEFMGPAREAIVSSEDFCFFSEQEWRRLERAGAERGIEVRVVIFIRNVLPFLASAYDQILKSGRLTLEFEDWAGTAQWTHGWALRNLAQVFPEERLRVCHYDSEKSNLLRAFFEALGVSEPRLAPLAGEIGVINRSLTRPERDLLLWINRNYPRSLFSEALNRGLQKAAPEARPEPIEISPELSESLCEKFSGETDWINQTFFGGRPVVGLGAVAPPRGTERSPVQEASRALEVH